MNFLEYAKSFKHKLSDRKTLIKLLTTSPPKDRSISKPGDIIKDGSGKYGFKDTTNKFVVFKDAESDKPYSVNTPITIEKGSIENYSGPKVETTIGRYLINYIVLVQSFGDKIPYVNEEYNIGKVEKEIANKMISQEITMAEYKKYIDNGLFLGHFAELCVPTISRKSITTDPKIKVRRKELLEKYKDQLHDPLIVEKIENELIALDAEYLKGDSSEGFLDGVGAKSRNIHRKKLFLSLGSIEEFTDGSSHGKFVEKSLSEGWDIKDFATIANDIRKGSYSRGTETAKGGALTKSVLRVFQDSTITEDNCNAKKGISIKLTKDEINKYIGRFLINTTGKTFTYLTEENKSEYLNKDVTLRSPLFCKTTNGLCYTCMGKQFGDLYIKNLSALAVDVSSTFMSLSMSAMHGSSLKSKKIEFEKYFR